MALRESICRNCAATFEFAAKGGVARPLCPDCETTHKWCPSCGYALVHLGFTVDPRTRDGLEGCCRQCKGRTAKARRERTYRYDPSAARVSKMLARYGMRQDDWDARVIAQGGRCAICETPTADLHIDHCHQSGAVRGLLCPPCNKGLGHFRDNLDRLVSAASYLMAAEPGIEVQVKRA